MKAASLVVACVMTLAVAAAACGKRSSGGGEQTPTPTPTPSPISGTITALTGTGAYLYDNATDTSTSTFSISLTANGQDYTDGGTWSCYGPIDTSGPGDSYDLFFAAGASVLGFDINIPAALWTSTGSIAIALGTNATGSFSVGTSDLLNITGGTVVLDTAPTAENDSASVCNFHLGTPLTFDDTTAAP